MAKKRTASSEGTGCCSMGCCKIDAMLSVDERGQMVLPKDMRDKAGIKPGDDILARLNPRPMQIQIDEAERLGLGTKKYNLVRMEP